MVKKLLPAVLFVALLFTAACGTERPGTERGAAPNETQVANRVGDMRVLAGDMSYAAAPAAERQAEPGRERAPVPQGGGGQQGGQARAGTIAGGSTGTGTTGGGAVSPEQAAIEEKYVARLQSLASGYESRVMALYSRGIQAMQSVPASDTQARAAVAGEYYSAGLALEAECDGQFYKILANFESELQAGGYPADKARQAQEAYVNTKRNRAAQLMEMAVKSLPHSN